MTPLTEEQSRLAAEHVGYAVAIARKLSKRCLHLRAEFEAAAVLGLCEAASRWGEDRRVPFKTWTYWRIKGACLDRKRAAGKRPVTLSLDATSRDDGDTLAQSTPSEDEPIGWEAESEDAVESLMSYLGSYERIVIRCQYLHGMKHTEIAKKLGTNRTSVCQWHADAIRKIRQRLTEGAAA